MHEFTPLGKLRIVYSNYYIYINTLPCDSLFPGHFCLAVVDALVAGHVMFHISSCPNGHPPI